MKEALSTTFTGLLVILAAAILSAAVMGGFSMEAPPPAPVNPLDVSLQAQQKDVEVVSTEQMREIVESGSHLILDARLQSEYDQAHIPTSMSVSVQIFEESFPQIAPMLDPDTPVVVYCTGPFCDDGLRLIERMREAGYHGGVLYLDGMEGGVSKLFRLALRLVISGLFLYSGAIKLLDLPGFSEAVQGYQLLPADWIMPFSAVLPWLEIWCAVALWITPPFRRAAWIWSTLLLVAFTLAKSSVMLRGIVTACGCGGSDDPMTWTDVWINGIWLVFSGAGWRWDKRGE